MTDSTPIPWEVESTELKPCPCGQTPLKLHIHAEDNTYWPKWARVYGDCCAMWEIEYRNGYADVRSAVGIQNAIDAWNEAPRGKAE